MNEINCDIYHIKDGIEKMKENEEIDRLHVWDSDCVMRGIGRKEMVERNCHHNAESVCYLEYIVDGSFRFSFHQNQIDEYREFCFRPPGTNEIGTEDYHTPVKNLGKNLKEVVYQIEQIYSDIIWDLSKINGASIAHGGHITDFEFEFEIVCIQ